MHFNSKVKINF